MMLALWMTVIFFLPLILVNSKAYSISLAEDFLVVTFNDSITPGYTSCSIPENSPKIADTITFCVLPNDSYIDVGVPTLNAGNRKT